MNCSEPHAIEQQLLAYLRGHADVSEDFDATTDLIEYGVLDSLLVTDLVLHIQTKYGIALTARDISPENLGSVERMGDLIRERQDKHRRAA